jgi:hypothetical protein
MVISHIGGYFSKSSNAEAIVKYVLAVSVLNANGGEEPSFNRIDSNITWILLKYLY